MTNRRGGGHVDLRVAVSVIKRFEFLFESASNKRREQEAQLSPSDRAMRLVSSNRRVTGQLCRNYLYDKS